MSTESVRIAVLACAVAYSFTKDGALDPAAVVRTARRFKEFVEQGQ